MSWNASETAVAGHHEAASRLHALFYRFQETTMAKAISETVTFHIYLEPCAMHP